jgi:hypothetical protein
VLTVPLATGLLGFWQTYVATGASGERTPFQLIACDAQGGDPDHIESADAALAISLGRFPVVAQDDPNSVLSFSWPINMEAQDLYPVSTSTYTWPTGSKSEVPCSRLNKVVPIEREACPASFDNPIDPNYIKPCVKVRLTTAVTHCMPLEAINPPQVQDTSHTSSQHYAHTHTHHYEWDALKLCPVAAYTVEEYSMMWAASNAIGVIGLLLNAYLATTWYLPQFLPPFCFCLFV